MSARIDKTAVITGVCGQDGSYLAQLLLAKGYRVIGTSHRSPVPALAPAPALARASARLVAAGLEPEEADRIELLHLDLASTHDIRQLIATVQADEVYNLAARSSSAQLFDDPIATAEINGLAAVRLLEAIRLLSPHTRFCQAASSEVYAGASASPQDETTPIAPLNAYGAAKAYAMHTVASYRSYHGVHASSAILYNHESPRRGEDYVTRKITRAVAQIVAGHTAELVLGDLDSRRDWGYAADYVEALWRMQQQARPADYVIASGETHSVAEFCALALGHVGLDPRDHVRVDAALGRRSEAVELRGDARKARDQLGWSPSVAFEDLVRLMVDADCARVRAEPELP